MRQAIERARAIDPSPEARWPQSFPGTHAYRLVQRLLEFSPPAPDTAPEPLRRNRRTRR